MKIQPVTAKVQAAYPMLAKAAVTAIAAASFVSTSCAQEEQGISGVPAPPPSQDGKNDSATPSPKDGAERQPGRGDGPECDDQDIGGEAPLYLKEQVLGGEIDKGD